jgi:hypothetical protein
VTPLNNRLIEVGFSPDSISNLSKIKAEKADFSQQLI